MTAAAAVAFLVLLHSHVSDAFRNRTRGSEHSDCRLRAQPHHSIPSPLELVLHGLDGHVCTPRPEDVDDSLDVRRRRPAELQERKDPYFRGYPQHLLQGADVKGQVELFAVQEEQDRWGQDSASSNAPSSKGKPGNDAST